MGWGLNTGRVIYFSLSKTGYGATKPPVRWVADGKEPGHKVDASHQSTAVVKNKCSYTSATPICLHGMERDKITLLLIMNSSESLEKLTVHS